MDGFEFMLVGEGSPLPKILQKNVRNHGRRNASPTIKFLPYQQCRARGETSSFDCRDRRPRRSGKQQILLFIRLPIIAGCKLKILSFPGRRVLVATRSRSRSDTTPWCHSLRSRRFATSPPTRFEGNRIKERSRKIYGCIHRWSPVATGEIPPSRFRFSFG